MFLDALAIDIEIVDVQSPVLLFYLFTMSVSWTSNECKENKDNGILQEQ